MAGECARAQGALDASVVALLLVYTRVGSELAGGYGPVSGGAAGAQHVVAGHVAAGGGRT